MGLYNTFQSDSVREREGRWFEVAAAANNDKTIPGFKMARMHTNNPAYQAALERIYKEHGSSIENDIFESAKARPLLLQVFAETVMLDWRNVQPLDNGVAIPYSSEAAIKLLEDLPDLYDLLRDYAKKLGYFRRKEEEEATKKSQPLSDLSLEQEAE